MLAVRLTLLTAMVFAVLVAPDAFAAPPPGLSRMGRTLWQFEALLNDTFKGRRVSAHYDAGRNEWNFACSGLCAPLADWNRYFFTFSEARHSKFHLSKRRWLPSFGNYPAAIKVKGRYVACEGNERRFLITYRSGVGLSLACLAWRQ